jgi:hypothetical protein
LTIILANPATCSFLFFCFSTNDYSLERQLQEIQHPLLYVIHWLLIERLVNGGHHPGMGDTRHHHQLRLTIFHYSVGLAHYTPFRPFISGLITSYVPP